MAEQEGPIIEQVAVESAAASAAAAAEVEVEYVVDEDSQTEPANEVLSLLCVLEQQGEVLKGRRIWRRVAIPSTFNLLELHVALQNAFDWEDTHLHDFSQPRRSLGISKPAPYSGFGRTDTSGLVLLDLDSLPPTEVRTLKVVVGAKEELGDALLTPADERKGGEGKSEGERGGEDECVVYVEHSHPHAEPDPPPVEKSLALQNGPLQVLEERSFLVTSVLNDDNPLLIYEYDFRVNYDVHIFFEGRFGASEGVNYPTCLAGAGASPAEDGDDLDDEGNLLPTYVFEEFAVMDVLANFEKTYEDSWPLGPGTVDTKALARCYMCRYNRECGRRRECSGKCCSYCLKAPVAQLGGRQSLGEADEAFEKLAERIFASRKTFVEEGKCDWIEDDGQPCVVCN